MMTPPDIITHAAAAFGVTASQITGSSGRRDLSTTHARDAAIYTMVVHVGTLHKTAAEALGRDRTAISHALKRVEAKRNKPGRFSQRLRVLLARVNAEVNPL